MTFVQKPQDFKTEVGKLWCKTAYIKIEYLYIIIKSK